MREIEAERRARTRENITPAVPLYSRTALSPEDVEKCVRNKFAMTHDACRNAERVMITNSTPEEKQQLKQLKGEDPDPRLFEGVHSWNDFVKVRHYHCSAAEVTYGRLTLRHHEVTKSG